MKRYPTDMDIPKVELASGQLNATPEARVTLPMDFSSIKAVVTATGNGDLQMTINSDNPFSMMGDYKINNGLFKIDFVNLIEKELKLIIKTL